MTSPAGQRAGSTPLYFMQTTVRHPVQNRLESPRNFVSLNAVSTESLATGVRTTTSTIALPSHSELQHYDSSPTRMCLQSSNQPPPELKQPFITISCSMLGDLCKTCDLHSAPGPGQGRFNMFSFDCWLHRASLLDISLGTVHK